MRELILENGEPAATIKKVWEFAKGYKDGKFDLDDPIVKKWYRHLENCSDYERFKREKAKRFAELKKLHGTVYKIPKGSEWPTYKNKVSCTPKEAEDLENLKQDLHSQVDELFPICAITEDKPKFEMSKM